jgi:hypothetical protein
MQLQHVQGNKQRHKHIQASPLQLLCLRSVLFGMADMCHDAASHRIEHTASLPQCHHLATTLTLQGQRNSSMCQADWDCCKCMLGQAKLTKQDVFFVQTAQPGLTSESSSIFYTFISAQHCTCEGTPVEAQASDPIPMLCVCSTYLDLTTCNEACTGCPSSRTPFTVLCQQLLLCPNPASMQHCSHSSAACPMSRQGIV